MVEQASLNSIFGSLADPTRRDILARVYERRQTITQLAKNYKMSFAATAKHIKVLENAKLVTKSRKGKEQVVAINGKTFEQANDYLQDYARLLDSRFDQLESLLEKDGEELRCG